MVARTGLYQGNFNGGELDPAAHGGTHLKNYYSSVARMNRFQPVPQGGFTLMPGSMFRGLVRGTLASVGNYVVGPVTTAAAGVIWSQALAASNVVAVNISGLSSTLDAGAILAVETETSAVWSQVGTFLTLRKVTAQLRVALAPGQRRSITGVRLRLISAPSGSTTITFNTVTVYAENDTANTVVRLVSFAYSSTLSYVMVATPGHLDIWHGADGAFAYSGAAPLPHLAGQLLDTHIIQRGDTALLFHQDVAPHRLLRLSVDQWALDLAPFIFVPDVDFGGTYTHVAESWPVYLNFPTSFTFGTQKLELTVSGETTSAISVTGLSPVADCAAIKDALEALPSIEPGVEVNQAPLVAGSIQYLITFAGEGNIGNTYDVTGRVVSSTSVAVQASRIQKGKKGGEPIFSFARGYPSTGIFFQDRLVLAGFKSKPNAFLASRTGEYFDMNVEATAASGAILVAMDLDGAEQITHLVRGRHLIVMTTNSEWFVTDKALVRSTPPNLVRSSGIGTTRRTPVQEQEGSIIYVSKQGTQIFAATYADLQQGYESQPVSLLASHMILGVMDAALEHAAGATDADRYWMVRADGKLICGHLLRNQDVTAFSRWETDGDVRAVAVDGGNTVWLAVARMVGETMRLCIETLSDDTLYDAAKVVALAPAASVVAGYDHLNGQQIYVTADGWRLGPLLVTAGQITLDEPASTVTAGLWSPPDLTTLPAVRDVGPQRVMKRPGRIHTLKVDLLDTESIAVGANGRAARDVPLARFGDVVTAPPIPQSRQATVTGLLGWTGEVQASFTQVTPGKLTVRNLTAEARL